MMSGVVQASAVDDIRILVDVSGSMRNTDPKNLRVPAVRMLNGLIPSGSNAGVWTFGRYVNMEVKWGKVDDNWRKMADSGVAKIHSRGQFTHIESALVRASSSWKKADPRSRRNIILLTDGKVDISKHAAKNDASRKNILVRILPQLVKNGVSVHTIALSAYSDESLLKQIAVKTSGSFEVANSAQALQRIFLHMFERAAKPDTVPLTGNKFSVDNSIREMTLLVFRKEKKKTRLIQPDGKIHDEDKHAPNIRWRNDLGYDLITVKKPLAGKWKLDADVDPDNRVMIVTDLKLVVSDLPSHITPDTSLGLQVELHSKNKKISKKSFLKFVKFSITHEVDGNSSKTLLNVRKSREIADKGIYVYDIAAPLTEGSHELVISADARVFDRSKRLKFEVQWPLEVDIKKSQKPAEYDLTIKPREEYIQADSLQLEVVLKRPDGLQQPLIMALQNKMWTSRIVANEFDGLHQVLINVKAKSIHGNAVDHKLDGYTVLGARLEVETASESTPAMQENAGEHSDSQADEDSQDSDENDSDLFQTIMIIVSINIVALLIVAGIYFYRRKKKSTEDEFDLFTGSDDDKEMQDHKA